LSGLADCCIATEAAARAFGLDFVPISSERFDFVIPMELASSPSVQRVLDAMQRSAFRRELDVLGGYDTSHTGQVVT
jgi:molybdate-binding protein